MKKLCWYGGLWLAVGLCLQGLYAGDIIKTATGDLSYFDALQTFNVPSNTVQGWVRLNRGFSIDAGAIAYMDTFITVSGPIDLGDTGILVLKGNLFLDKNVTLANNGSIKGTMAAGGPAGTIFLGGDLTLGSDTFLRMLHITGDWSASGVSGDTIIDGMGHTLTIGDWAQIMVDQNVTLTLRNMTIRTSPNSPILPAIKLASSGSKLALDNVMFDLGADFKFVQGQLFIHNNVVVNGKAAFVYNSPQPSYITSGATWSFEEGTTFSVAPATFTDVSYKAGVAVSNNFIVLADQSSTLRLNGCSFKTTCTGLRLTKGAVLFDNQVPVDTQAAVGLNTTPPWSSFTGTGLGEGYCGVAWAPSERYILVAAPSAGQIYGWTFDGTSGLGYLGNLARAGARKVAWSPDERFFATFGDASHNDLHVYKFNGTWPPTEIGSGISYGTGTGVGNVAWSPDGKFLAVAYTLSSYHYLAIYRFNGVSYTQVGTTLTLVQGGDASILWSPDGRYLVEGKGAYGTFAVFRFNGASTPVQVGGNISTSRYVNDIAWSPDGRYFFIATGSWNSMLIYRFDGSAVSGITEVGTGWVNFIKVLPDGQHIVTAGPGSTTFYTYRFAGATLVFVGSAIMPGSFGALDSALSSSGRFFAVTTADNALGILRCNYASPSAISQSFTSGLVFGDSAKGSNFDAAVKIMGNARVGIKGKVSDDSA